MSGMIVILPPSSFTIDSSAAPQLPLHPFNLAPVQDLRPSPAYNELPCMSGAERSWLLVAVQVMARSGPPRRPLGLPHRRHGALQGDHLWGAPEGA